MRNMKVKVALFDFDGVVMDTEGQYTVFWDKIGEKILGRKGFCHEIKGTTLIQIFDRFFSGDLAVYRDEIASQLFDFEKNMCLEYVPGADVFIRRLKEEGVRTAIVTSSNTEKMEVVLAAHPELHEMFDLILTDKDFRASKPDPDCFLQGMRKLGGTAEDTVVFEDSFHGLAAGRASKAKVVGLATTNPADAIAPCCDIVIPDFVGLTPAELFAKL